MMKRIVIWAIFLSAIQGMLAQEKHIPYRDVEVVEDGVIVTYHFNGASIVPNSAFPNTYLWKIPNFGINDIEGEPAVPFRWDIFTIPPSHGFEVELLDSAYNDTILALSPAINPYPCMENAANSIKRKGIAPYQGFFPQETLLSDNSQHYDGYSLLRICVQPVKYDYEHHIIRHYSYIKYKVRYITSNQKQAVLTAANDINPILGNISLNYQTLPSVKETKALRSTASSLETNRHLLIISTPEFTDAINHFAKWKRTKGWTVHVEMGNAWTTNSVKSAVQNVYAATNGSLKYLLLVGDVEFIPTEFIDDPRHPHMTDLYYGCISNSHIPEVHRGRIPVKTNAEAQIVFNKIMNYERNPVNDDSFYQRGLHCAFFQGKDGEESSRFVRTSEDVRNAILSLGKSVDRVYKCDSAVTPLYWSDVYADGTAIPDSLRLGNFNWNRPKTEITDNINNGVFYVLYKGHGEASGWNSFEYTVNDLASLSNSKLPVFINSCCLTGAFHESTDCFSEVLLKKENGGGVGVFAATEESGMGYSDAMTIGMFDAIWPTLNLRPAFPGISYSNMTPVLTPIYEMGAVLDQGLLRMEETYGRISINVPENSVRLYELFHYFGDPTMQMYTAKPQNFVKPAISKNGNTINVQTNDGSARIIFYNPLTENVLSYYGTNAQISTDADSLIICVDRHNYVPYVLQYYKNLYIQNESITGAQNYWGQNIMVGKNVTTSKPQGPAVIQNANVKMKATTVELCPGTTITNSNVEINGPD